MDEGLRSRGVTPRSRSGAAAESTRLRQRRNRREELPRLRGQRGRLGGDTPRPKPEARGSGWEELPHAPKPEARGNGREEIHHTPSLRPRKEVGKSKGTIEARGGGREDQAHGQGRMAAWAQEGLEELFHTEGQEGRQ